MAPEQMVRVDRERQADVPNDALRVDECRAALGGFAGDQRPHDWVLAVAWNRWVEIAIWKPVNNNQTGCHAVQSNPVGNRWRHEFASNPAGVTICEASGEALCLPAVCSRADIPVRNDRNARPLALSNRRALWRPPLTATRSPTAWWRRSGARFRRRLAPTCSMSWVSRPTISCV